MDKIEFNQWLTKHQNAYPACASWMGNLPDHRDTLRIWMESLANVTLAHATEATMRMVRGVEPIVHYTNWHDTPRFVLDHVKSIERESKPYRPNDVKEPAYRCKECFDTGVILVYLSHDVAAIRGNTFRGTSVKKSATVCNCEGAKHKYAGMLEAGIMRTFSSFQHVRLPANLKCCGQQWLADDVERIRAANVDEMVPINEWKPN